LAFKENITGKERENLSKNYDLKKNRTVKRTGKRTGKYGSCDFGT
jgi:hypothetical protein